MFTKFFIASTLLMTVSCFAETSKIEHIDQLHTGAFPPKMTPKPDFDAYTVIPQRKKAFIAFLKLGVEFINARIQSTRERIQSLESKERLSTEDKDFLKHIAKLFDLPVSVNGFSNIWFSELLKRVDIIPLELVLSQAAIESSWGTSRFAREGNNYFGQWCYEPNCGMVPSARPSGRTYEVKTFADPYDSIRAYFMNVNTNYAYVPLRDLREILRRSNKPLSGYELASGLELYSQRGEAYVLELQEIIRYNQSLWHQE